MERPQILKTKKSTKVSFVKTKNYSIYTTDVNKILVSKEE